MYAPYVLKIDKASYKGIFTSKTKPLLGITQAGRQAGMQTQTQTQTQTHTHTHTYTHTPHTHTHTHTHTHMHTHTHTHMHTCSIHAQICAYTHAHAQSHTHTNTDSCMHTCIYAHTDMHMHPLTSVFHLKMLISSCFFYSFVICSRIWCITYMLP